MLCFNEPILLRYAQVKIGLGCEIWIKYCRQFQVSLNHFVDTLLGGCRNEALQVNLNFPKVCAVLSCQEIHIIEFLNK